MRTLTVNDPVIKNDGKLTKLGSLGGGGGEPPAELGGLTFRESEEGKGQYKLPDSDEWQDFSSGGGAPERTLVWENPNPTAQMTTQEINLTNQNFDYFEVEMSRNVARLVIGDVNVVANGSEIGGGVPTCRRYGSVTQTYIYINDGFVINPNGSATQGYHNVAIPIKIYGVKEN